MEFILKYLFAYTNFFKHFRMLQSIFQIGQIIFGLNEYNFITVTFLYLQKYSKISTFFTSNGKQVSVHSCKQNNK